MASKKAAAPALALALLVVVASLAVLGTTAFGACPPDALLYDACVNALGVVRVGQPSCCSLLAGLADAEAAACLCTALKANLLGLQLNIPVNLSVVGNKCSRQGIAAFEC